MVYGETFLRNFKFYAKLWQSYTIWRYGSEYPDPYKIVVILNFIIIHQLLTSVADPDPGSGAFLTPGSGIRDG